ncbi:MAG: hypothetical protein KAI81_08945, partial [Candidatus Marinimicrobia bacterium]|nr:hypothetical protein [Candidatus Neomarinimicrobiota bacterium]
MNNKLIKGIISISLLTTFLFSANIQKVETAEKVFTTVAPVPMSGTPILNDLETVALLSRIGNASNEIKLKKTQVDSLGMSRDFFVSNIVTDEFDAIEFKLLAKGNLAQVWCAAEEIDNGHLTQQVADSFLVYLEKKSGASSVDPFRGVIAIDQEYFGTPPNKDGDDLLDVFVCDIKDGWEVGSNDGYVAGFFYGVDQYNDADIIDQGYRSNERDIIYIDSYPGVFLNDVVRYHGGITTTAHEYQHLIHYNYDGSEYTIVNEGLSENAEYITGLATRSADRYLENVNVPIFKWDREGEVLDDYARASLFYNYIGDRFGLRNYKFHTQGEMNGKYGIESAIYQSIKPAVNFAALIHDFHIANLINDRSVAEKYAYANPARNGLWIPEQAAHLM